MTEMLFAGVLMFQFVTAFVFSFQYGGWNRAYVGLYGGPVEASIVNYMPYRPAAKPHFDTVLVKEYVGRYVKENMEPYCRSMPWTPELLDDAGAGEYQTRYLTFDVDFGFRQLKKSACFMIKESL